MGDIKRNLLPGRPHRRRQGRPRFAMGGYTDSNLLRRNKELKIISLLFTAALYGFAFAMYSYYLLLQLLLPLAVLAVLVIWLLPDTGHAPVRILSGLLTAFMVALLCWPDYLALALPGLPWITALRLTTVPILLVLLICVSVSSRFRRELGEALGASPWIWRLLVLFNVLAFLSIAVSQDKAESVSKFIIAILYWTSIFFASCYVFLKPGRAFRFQWMLWGMGLFICVIGLLEWRRSQVPWAGRIPSFLKIEDENVQRILTGAARAATGIYRAQSKFTTSLGYAEFLALLTPFIIHLFVTSRSIIVRTAALAMLPFIFFCIRTTDSRFGVLGYFMSFLLYLAIWAFRRWRTDKGSIFGPAIILAYPLILAAFVAGTFFVGRLRSMVWGSGAQQFSTQARQAQYDVGIPMIFSQPWGRGIGRGAFELGFVNQAGILTIDTYYLVIGLEVGVIGFIAYFGMIIAAGYYGGMALLKSRDQETALLAPLIIALANFLLIKSVFSQQDNHPLIFMMLGIVVALVWRVRQQERAANPAHPG